jgi:two-component system, OmpR family, response regulator
LRYNAVMRILVVEDEHRIAAAIKKGLEQERHVVDVAYTGTEGYDLAVTEDYDVIVLDLMLPEMDGREICRKLRSGKNQTPILILTAKNEVSDKVTGLNDGADDYLTKPFAFEEFLARLAAITRRPKVAVIEQLRVGSLLLNTTTFEVSRSEKVIRLSSKEFALLEYLMRHNNVILTKEQIINHLWDYEADILPNTIEVYIRNLRKKIDIPFPADKPLIQTVRGFGYKIGV